jgi:uncharacterized protein
MFAKHRRIRRIAPVVLAAGVLLALAAHFGFDGWKDKNQKLIDASGAGRLKKVKGLLDSGADVHAREQMTSFSALELAAMGEHTEVIRALLQKGANVDARDRVGYTPLIRAAQAGHAEALKLLLEKGADPNAKQSAGLTALMEAAGAGHANVVRLLVERGANPDVKGGDDGYNATALMWAAGCGQVEVAKELLACGANVNVKTKIGRTALWGLQPKERMK